VKVAQVVAEEFGIDLDRVKITATATDKVPNTSPTAASSGSDLNGMAALDAARQIKDRMAERSPPSDLQVPVDQVVFRPAGAGRRAAMTFAELAKKAYLNRISLSAAGFYATPKIHWDRSVHRAGRSSTSPMARPCPR
jgi:xanthine dehydrogenase large subunit